MPWLARCLSSAADWSLAAPRQIDKQNIRLRRFDLQPVDVRQAICQPLGQRMVVSQPGDVVIKRMQGCGRQHATLTHAATGHLANAVCAGDQRLGTHQG